MSRTYRQVKKIKVQHSLSSVPHKGGKYQVIYILAYIFTKKQWTMRTKTSENSYLFRERERLEVETRPL